MKSKLDLDSIWVPPAIVFDLFVPLNLIGFLQIYAIISNEVNLKGYKWCLVKIPKQNKSKAISKKNSIA